MVEQVNEIPLLSSDITIRLDMDVVRGLQGVDVILGVLDTVTLRQQTSMKADYSENVWVQNMLRDDARGMNLREALDEAVLMLDGTSLLACLVLGPERKDDVSFESSGIHELRGRQTFQAPREGSPASE